MQILSGHKQDTSRLERQTGGYEWWYFDGLSSDGELGFTIIFYNGNPFSRRYIRALRSSVTGREQSAESYPALSISIYQKGEPVYYGFCEHKPDEADFSSDKVYGKVGRSEFRFGKKDNKICYKIHLNQELPCGDKLNGNLKFTSNNYDIHLSGSDLSDIQSKHSWNLVQPVADVSGELNIDGYRPHQLFFKGQGYHDHNTGLEPLDHSFRDWYWGRFHLNGFTFIYYIMQRWDEIRNMAWLIKGNGGVDLLDKKCILEHETLNLFGLKSARKIIISGENTRCLIQQDKLLDNGPFYQRFRSGIIMDTENGLLQGTGLTEYIYPSRIKSRVFRPLVNMRICYPGTNKHWVQKSPRLYRWTW